MISRLKGTWLARLSARLFGWLQDEMAPALLRRRAIGVAVIVSLLAVVYWMLIASDRYVSESRIIIQRTDLSVGQSMDFSSLLSGASTGNRADQLLLRDHLLSADMLRKLDGSLKLREHYSSWKRDPLSRMMFADAPMEMFFQYYRSRVSVELDEYSGVLVVRAQAYDSEKARAITAMLVMEGEYFMNEMAHSLAQAQVAFLEKQVVLLNDRALQARQAVIDYQNKKGLVSPRATAESIAAIIARLEAQRTELETQRSAMQAYLVANHPNIVLLNQQIAAVEKQLIEEQAKLAAPGGKPLNRTVEEFQRLEMEASFSLDMYKTALVALEKGRIEATRIIKKVSVIQAPSLPEIPLEPRRGYNAVVFVLFAMLLSGVVQMLSAIIRDHKD